MASNLLPINLACGMLEVRKDNYAPNHMPFDGTLLLVDQPSSGPPHGLPLEFEGMPILLPSGVAEGALDSLRNMGVNFKTTMDGHDKLHKIGVIEYAWLDGNELRVSGFIYDKDFPEEAALIKTHQAELGMSMESTQTVLTEGNYEGIPVAVVASLVFTGATILRKMLAAYNGTSLAANLSKELKAKMEEQLIELLAAMKAMQEGLTALSTSTATLSANVVGLDAKFTTLEEKVVAVDAKVEDKVTTLSAALETVPKEGIKLEEISASITTIVKAELEAANKPLVAPVRKTTPLARYGDVTGKDLEAAIHNSEGQPVDKIAALIMAEMLQARSE